MNRYIYERVHDLEQSSNKELPEFTQSDSSINKINKAKGECFEEDRSREETRMIRQYNFHGPVVFCENTTSQDQRNG